MADDFINRATQYYLSQGLPQHQAAALAAQATHESAGGNPLAQQQGGPGFGLYQWSPTRKADLYQYGADQGLDPEGEETQLGFALHEMNNKEKAAGDKFFGSQNYQQAIDTSLGYLRPQNYDAANPGNTIHYTDRYNLGAPIAGQDPIAVSPLGQTQAVGAGAGGQGAMASTPGGGLLQPGVDPALAGWSNVQNAASQANISKNAADNAAQDKALASASSDLTKQGLGLLAQSHMPAPQFASAGALFHRPDAQATPMPNFTQALMQQRLMRRT